MTDEIHFPAGVCGPEVDGQDEVRGVDVTVRTSRYVSCGRLG